MFIGVKRTAYTALLKIALQPCSYRAVNTISSLPLTMYMYMYRKLPVIGFVHFSKGLLEGCLNGRAYTNCIQAREIMTGIERVL